MVGQKQEGQDSIAKRKPGRPRKVVTQLQRPQRTRAATKSEVVSTQESEENRPATEVKRRGRPRKRPLPTSVLEEVALQAPRKRQVTQVLNMGQRPKPGSSAWSTHYRYSVTIAVKGGHVPTSWLERAHDYIQRFCKAGAFSTETGGRKDRLHLQGCLEMRGLATDEFCKVSCCRFCTSRSTATFQKLLSKARFSTICTCAVLQTCLCLYRTWQII